MENSFEMEHLVFKGDQNMKHKDITIFRTIYTEHNARQHKTEKQFTLQDIPAHTTHSPLTTISEPTWLQLQQQLSIEKCI